MDDFFTVGVIGGPGLGHLDVDDPRLDGRLALEVAGAGDLAANTRDRAATGEKMPAPWAASVPSRA